MSAQMPPFNQSSSGDAWLLGRDCDSGEAVVIHKANAASGGYQEHIAIDVFLSPSRKHSAEAQALLRLVKTRMKAGDG